MNPKRPESLRFAVLVHPYPNDLIVYEPEAVPLRIIRILHAARDLPAILTQP
jgi:plasmid stabilization system protein ParE